MSAIGSAAIVFGFVLFAIHVMRDTASDSRTADGIVVLTGPDNRIAAGARLLQQKRGKRMLISGVNRITGRGDIERISRLSHETFTCCVDLGYEALDTVGNADETRRWVKSRGYTSLIVVTSSYHMPRSMAELSSVMPDVTLIPYRVTPRRFTDGSWWLDVPTSKTLLSEYLKFIPAAARAYTSRYLGLGDTPSTAVQPATAARD